MSKKLKLSPWRSVKKPPARSKVGIYEAKCNQKTCDWPTHFSWWNGEMFCGLWMTKRIAYLYRASGEDESMTEWRGVLK